MTEAIAADSFPYLGEEHTMLRHTLRRFVADRVQPFADAWEEQGFVPRETLREMGALGLFGMRYAPEYGGSGLDTLANAVLAEELGRSTYGGFAVTVLVHTDMASPHLNNAGTREQLRSELGSCRRAEPWPTLEKLARELRLSQSEALDSAAAQLVEQRVARRLVVDENGSRGDVADSNSVLREHRDDQADRIERRQAVD